MSQSESPSIAPSAPLARGVKSPAVPSSSASRSTAAVELIVVRVGRFAAVRSTVTSSLFSATTSLTKRGSPSVMETSIKASSRTTLASPASYSRIRIVKEVPDPEWAMPMRSRSPQSPSEDAVMSRSSIETVAAAAVSSVTRTMKATDPPFRK